MRLFLLCVLIALAHGELAAQASGAPAARNGSVSQIHPPPADHRFPNGLALEYKGEWRIFDAGAASVRMESAGGQQRVVASADSTGFVSKLFHVHDTFESFFDPKTFCTLHLTKHIEEGSRIRDINIRFDNAARKSILDQKVPSTGE